MFSLKRQDVLVKKYVRFNEKARTFLLKDTELFERSIL